MLTTLIILIVIVSILLVLVVLAQNSKGGSFASNFSASNQLIGVKKTGDLLEKLTWGFSIALMSLCLITTLTIEGPEMDNQGGTPATRSATQQGVPNLAPPTGEETPAADPNTDLGAPVDTSN